MQKYNNPCIITGNGKNNTVGSDGLIPTLLVFGIIPRITLNLTPLKTKYNARSRLTKLLKNYANYRQKKINEVINTKNGPRTDIKIPTFLKLGNEILVYRGKNKWTGPYEVFDVTNLIIILKNN